ncbi:hypothetical protein A6M27_02925 [Acidithiobacillus thiooxidans]|uniref:Uncharacterized protein n=1 Tax=Acidithiobacillus thiooxidans TaxID=930 RepID=A0A1C2IPQ0_ACITH|nr:hypothetical protein [Acidithiobacillus thiooxidans]OCX76225.1 hypothetical protein A6P07_02720 [Acidithiobacillus thiooxidans]OCX77969.1 hypothetical protein A6O24_05760 [Acidithiobacillus thiooxidans]OCX84924.1 hypothetical protein A6O26_02965 [Acidithiobacillus thiooxidans]OCX89303.1 hypothetical protein A6M27_02925 [Acidithiobacillus thiooxidans]OFC49087.1 hypothetical protein BAE47_05910 [Acidithiobacillus thiooxidans]
MAEKEYQAEKMKHINTVVLTHRRDLPKREGVIAHVNNESVMQTVYPGQSVTGDFLRLDDRPGSLWMKHPKLGELLVHTNKNIFKPGDELVNALQQSKGHPVTLSLDKTGTKLFVVQNGLEVKQDLKTPALPMGLVQSGLINYGVDVTGELKGVYNKGATLEIQTKDGPFFYGQLPGTDLAQSEVSARKMIGKKVELSYGHRGALTLRSLEVEPQLGKVG